MKKKIKLLKLKNRAASFNIDIVKNVARITAEETRAVGVPWNFNPVLDVGRQPLWPRMYETYGEDHFVGKFLIEKKDHSNLLLHKCSFEAY